MTTQLWQHIRSGEVFAVTIDERGDVCAAAGPLHHSERETALRDGFDSDAELADDLNATADEYRLYEPA